MEEKSNSLKEPIIKVEDNKSESSNKEIKESESTETILDFKDETLEEDIWESMVKNKLKNNFIFIFKKRDLRRIGNKLEYVIIPRFSADSSKELKNWDLWGPLLFTLALCV